MNTKNTTQPYRSGNGATVANGNSSLYIHPQEVSGYVTKELIPAVDARFLLDIVEILPGATFRASNYRPDIGGIYFESADGFGILLPVRKTAQKSA